MLKHFKSLLKDSAIYAMGNISAKIVGIILLPVYVNTLTTAEYGMLGTLEATMQIITVIAGFNLASALLRWHSDPELHAHQASAFFTLLTTVTLLAVALLLAAWPLAPRISGILFDAPGHARLIRLMTCSAALDITGNLPATLCRAQLKSGRYTLSIIVRLTVTMTCTILFITRLNRGIEGIYEAQIIGASAYLLLFLPYIIKNSTARFERAILIKMIHYSLPLFLSSFFGVLLTAADRLSLNFITGLTGVGVYSLGLKIASALKTVLVQPVSMAIPPMMFRMSAQPDAKQFYARLMTVLVLGFMLPVLAVSLFGQEAVKLITSRTPDYWEAWKVIPFISFGTVFLMMKDQSVYILQLVKKTGIIAAVIITVSLINLALNLLLIPMAGAMGAALATLFSGIIYFIALLHFARRYYPVPYEFRRIFTAIIIGAVFCTSAFAVSSWSLSWRLIIKGILVAGYLPVLYACKCFGRKELAVLRSLLRIKN